MSRKAKELTLHSSTVNDANEPQDDGAVDWNVDDIHVDNDEYDGGGGHFVHFDENLKRLWRWE